MTQTTDEEILSTENTEVYNIICDSLGIEPKANNGTLRLPLKPIGFHLEDESEEPEDPPEKFPTGSTENPSSILDEVQKLAPLPASAFAAPASAVTPSIDTQATGKPSSTAGPDTAEEQNQNQASDSESSSNNNTFWDYLHEKLEAIKAWAAVKISGATNHSTSAHLIR